MADLLSESIEPILGPHIVGLDIGCGASCIYSLLGAKEYGWRFVASDVDSTALRNASELLKANGLEEQILLRTQRHRDKALRGVLKDRVALQMCNPPFHESMEHAQKAALRKWERLGKRGAEKNYQVGLEF